MSHWSDRAACLGQDDVDFHSTNETHIFEAKRICGMCPVRTECLMDALERDDDHGVYGGLTASERATLRTRRRPTACKRCGASFIPGERLRYCSSACADAAHRVVKNAWSKRAKGRADTAQRGAA